MWTAKCGVCVDVLCVEREGLCNFHVYVFCIYVLMGFSRNQHDVSAKFAYSHGSLAALLLFARKRRSNFLPCLTVFIKFACCSPRIKIPRGHRHQKKKQR